MANPWERRQVDTDPEGYTLPDGERHRWIDSKIELEVKASVITPDGTPFNIGCKFEGEDAARLLIDWLNRTAE